MLQLQSYWWQQGQVSQAIKSMAGGGGWNGTLIDPVLSRLVAPTATIETPLNIVLIIIFLGLGIGLLIVNESHLPPVLLGAIVVSAAIWYCTEALGGIFTGMATDFNSGLLLIIMALASWTHIPAPQIATQRRERHMPATRRSEQAG